MLVGILIELYNGLERIDQQWWHIFDLHLSCCDWLMERGSNSIRSMNAVQLDQGEDRKGYILH